MNTLQVAHTANQTMSSIEIAKLTGKEHKNVIADIRIQLFAGVYEFSKEKMAEKLAINKIQGLTVVLDNRGYWSEVLLDKYHTDILVSGYEVKYRAAIVKRWHELEGQQTESFQIPQTLSEALLLAGRIAAEKEAALAKIEADKPKVEFAETVRNMQGSCAVGDFAKTIGYGRNKLFKMLRDDLILMKNNLPYQRYIDMGCFVVIEQIPYTDSNGKTHPAFTPMVTGKGQVFLEKKYRKPLRNGLVTKPEQQT